MQMLTAPDWLQINQRLTIPVFRSTHGQQAASLSPKVATINNSAVLDAQQSDDKPSDAVIVPELPKSTVNKPTVLVPSVSLDYRVKAGDTLSLIARKHNISLQEIGKANELIHTGCKLTNGSLFLPFNTAVLRVKNSRQ